MRGLNKKWLKKDLSFGEADYEKMHRAFWQNHEATTVYRVLPATQTEALVHRCRKRHVSVNSALYVAFLAAQSRVQGEGRDEDRNVLVPVDLRDYLRQRADEALGLYSSALRLRFVVPPDAPFWRATQLFDAEVKRRLTDKNVFASQRINALHPSLLDGLAFAMHGDLDDPMACGLVERVLGKMRTGILVSNLGRLELPVEYGDLRLAALRPPAIYAGNAEKALEVLTFDGRMHLTMTFDGRVVDEGTVRAVVDAAMGILGDPAGW
jgi:hypothetical protein